MQILLSNLYVQLIQFLPIQSILRFQISFECNKFSYVRHADLQNLTDLLLNFDLLPFSDVHLGLDLFTKSWYTLILSRYWCIRLFLWLCIKFRNFGIFQSIRNAVAVSVLNWNAVLLTQFLHDHLILFYRIIENR